MTQDYLDYLWMDGINRNMCSCYDDKNWEQDISGAITCLSCNYIVHHGLKIK